MHNKAKYSYTILVSEHTETTWKAENLGNNIKMFRNFRSWDSVASPLETAIIFLTLSGQFQGKCDIHSDQLEHMGRLN
jgi:hypothetical protein